MPRAYLGSIGVLNLKLVLEHDHVPLALLVLHLGLESGAEGVEEVASRDDLLGLGEEADPPESGQDALLLRLGRERGLGLDGRDERSLVGRLGTERALGDLGPRERSRALGEEVDRRLVQEADVDEGFDEGRETLVPEGAADDRLGLGDLVELAERSRVAVRVGDERESRVDVVRLRVLHQVLAVDLDELALRVQLGRVEEGEEDTARRPRELVAEGVVGRFGSGETAAVRDEGLDLAAGAVDLVNSLDGVQVVDLAANCQRFVGGPLPRPKQADSHPGQDQSR